MGVWKGKGLEVKRSRGLDRKPCKCPAVYVAGRLDVRCPGDPPCRRGPAVVIARFLFAQNPTKRWYNCFAFGFASFIRPVHLYKFSLLRRLLRRRLAASKI